MICITDKTCSKCLQSKHLDGFPANKSSPTGRHTWCRECMAVYSHQRYMKHRERRLQQTAAYQRAHPEMSRASVKKWKETHQAEYREGLKRRYPKQKIVSKEWVANHRDRARLRHREWEARNRDKLKAKRLANREVDNLRHRVWREQNHDKWLAASQRRRARMLALPGQGFTSLEWANLKEKYSGRCLCCGQVKFLTADHVIPVSKGGSSGIENIQPLCRGCNSSKHTKTTDYR